MTIWSGLTSATASAAAESELRRPLFLKFKKPSPGKTGRFAGFEVSPRLPYRPEFAAGFKTGITALDKDHKILESLFKMPDLYARRDLKKITDFIWQNT